MQDVPPGRPALPLRAGLVPVIAQQRLTAALIGDRMLSLYSRRPASSFHARLRLGFTYVELMAAVMLVAIAGMGTILSWRLAPQAVANKRVTEMSVQLAASELERLRAFRYDNLTDTPVASPNVFYFDKNGGALASATGAAFKVKSWVFTQDSDGNSVLNSADLRELVTEVWNPTESKRYEKAQTLLTAGGI